MRRPRPTPRDEECTDCPVSKTTTAKRSSRKSSRQKTLVPTRRRSTFGPAAATTRPRHIRHTRRGHASYRSATPRHGECADCAPRRKYDSQEVVRKVRTVDHSRVINTRTVVPARSRVKRNQSSRRPQQRGPPHRRDPAQPHRRRKRNPLRPPHPGCAPPSNSSPTNYQRRGAAGFDHRSGLCRAVRGTARRYGRSARACSALRVRG